ncbi:MAG: nucleotidyltransferase domain-containing protein [Bacteroidetes Order II. Incertae sedis bacterium]|nr:nucleotidyltransferase domain-containing protein [Bacteroidetes Order II. bacterium]
MNHEISNALRQLEAEHHIRILYAVESGSRAWGFASPDSDWDVRFLYIHRTKKYLCIDPFKDSIEKMLSNGLDLAGWELKKTLRLFRKSNPPLLEWLSSPLIYEENGSLASKLRLLSKHFFSPKSTLRHYFHMAEGNFRSYLQKPFVAQKRYFYVLRPLLACDWIVSKQDMPPIEFEVLLNEQVKNPQLLERVAHLLHLKRAGAEMALQPADEYMLDFIRDKISFYTKYLQQVKDTSMPDTQALDRLFTDILTESFGNTIADMA